MKELSIEEKAKRYDEAIERAKSEIKNDKDHVLYKGDVIDIFPELYESKDERIRKALISVLQSDFENDTTIHDIRVGDIIAWLEKQCEQDMIPLNKAIQFLNDQLVDDKDEVTGEPFINFNNHGAFKETFISFFKRKMLEKQGEQKSNWSEEDEKMVRDAIGAVNIADYYPYPIKCKIENWLKSLKQRIGE